VFQVSDKQQAVLTGQAHNILVALSAICATLGYTEGSEIFTAFGAGAAGLFSLLSAFHIVKVYNVIPE